MEMNPEKTDLFHSFLRVNYWAIILQRALWFLTQKHFSPMMSYQQKKSLILLINQYVCRHITEPVNQDTALNTCFTSLLGTIKLSFKF